MTLEGHDQRR